MHAHSFSRSKPSASVETCACGKFRFTENSGPPIAEVKGQGMTDRLLFAWVNGKPAPENMQFPDNS